MEIISIFQSGIRWNNTVFDQDRFRNAAVKQKMVFWPNLLVSSPLFYLLEISPRAKLIISGPYGISKSTSLMFFIHFKNIITKYWYKVNQFNNKKFF